MERTSEVVKLTKAVVDRAQPALRDGKARQKLYLDAQLKGFGLCVGATAKSFFVQRDVAGRSVRTTIGRYGVFTVEQARAEARQILAKLARGVNPLEEKRAARAKGITLAEAWSLYRDTLQAKDRAPKTLHRYEHTLQMYLKSWLNRPLIEIGREEARTRHAAIAREVAAGKFAAGRPRTDTHGRNTANDALRVFRSVWNRARRQHPELPECPTMNVDWFRLEKPRTALAPEALRTWHRAVMADGNATRRDLLLLLLFTGLRRGDGQTIRLEHVDFERQALHIPKPKGGRAFDLPLSNYLLELLERRKQENEALFPGSPWAFPSLSKSGHIEEPRIEVAGVAWTPHDLRRTFITVAESLDISHYALKALVNHSQPTGDVTSGYIRLDLERLRAPVQAITDKLLALCEPQPGGQVVPLRRQG